MKIFDLPPQNGRKSFYGKAKCIEHPDGTIQLQSYNTIVAEIDRAGNYRKTWNGSTATTSAHIKSFKIFYNVED